MDHFTAVVLVDQFPPSHLILLKRSEEKAFMPGRVTGIGGKVEPGETIMGAALRELEEETGLAGISLHQFCQCEVDGNRQLHFFAGLFGGAALPLSPDGELLRTGVEYWHELPMIATAREIMRAWQERNFSVVMPFFLSLTTVIEWEAFEVGVREGIDHNISGSSLLELVRRITLEDDPGSEALTEFSRHWREQPEGIRSEIISWEPADQVRFIDALAMLTDPSAILLFSDLLKDNDEGVRGHSADALARIGVAHPGRNAEITQYLLPALEDKDLWTRVAVAEALADLAEIDQRSANLAVPRILQTLTQVDKKSAHALIERALERIGDHLILPLGKLLDDPHIGQHALWYLEHCESPEARALLEEWRADQRE